MVSKPKEKGVKALARTLTKRENTLRVTQSVEEAEIMSGKMFVPSVTLYLKINQCKIQERSNSPSTTLTSTPTVEAKWDNGTRTTWFVQRRRRPDDKTFQVLSNLLANITNKRGWKERLSWRGENNNNWTVGVKILHVHNGCVFFMKEFEKILVHPVTESFIELKWR